MDKQFNGPSQTNCFIGAEQHTALGRACTLSPPLTFLSIPALIILCINKLKNKLAIIVTHKCINSNEQTVDKVLSDLFIALLQHKFDNDYYKKEPVVV